MQFSRVVSLLTEVSGVKPYIRKVQYYETDMMGVTHHSNYVRWMEEARIDFLDQLGFPYAAMEAGGVISPVVGIDCRYKKPCSFGDEITISVRVTAFSGVKLTIEYDMRSAAGETVCTARSEHTFIDRSGHFVRMKKVMPDFCAAMESMIGEASDLPDRPQQRGCVL